MSDAADRHLVSEIRSAYEGAAAGWATGPAALYRRLAAALVSEAPRSLAGDHVLDLGTGTGVASEVLVAAGARPVGVDLAVAMLQHARAVRPPGVAGDGARLPFRADAFDAVVGAFSLNHAPEPETVLTECRRVTRAGGFVLASTFPSGADHPAKAVVESVLEHFGYERPDWYATFKDRVADRTGAPDLLLAAATAAGLREARVARVEVEAGLDDPDVAVTWRLNMPHTLPFLAALDEPTAVELHARARAALPARSPSSVPMLALVAPVT